MSPEFAALSDEFGFYKKNKVLSLAGRIINTFTGTKVSFDFSRYLQGVDLVLNNTITNGEILSNLRKHYSGPVITYVHELALASRLYTTESQVLSTLDSTNQFAVPSRAVLDHMKNYFDVPDAKMNFLNYLVRPVKAVSEENVSHYRHLHGITASFLVGALGTVAWHKGSDVFLQVAMCVFNQLPGVDLQFIWKGANENDMATIRMQYDIQKMGLSGKVIILEHDPDTAVFYSITDLFLLTSREDSYPLVVLEAAATGIPSIVFENAGGAAEFVGDDAGSVVPYLDINAMAQSVITYYYNRQILCSHGDTASEKVKRLHMDKELVFEQLMQIVEKLKG